MFQFTPTELSQFGLGMSIGGMFSSAIGSWYSAKNMQSQGRIADINARIADLGAESVLQQGQFEAGRLTMRAGQTKSSQRASMAANGIDLGVGSAAEVQATTDMMKDIDRETIRMNAMRSAFGYRAQATNLRMEADAKQSVSPFGAAATSLLGSAGGVARSWYQFQRGG